MLLPLTLAGILAIGGCALNSQGDREVSELIERYERERTVDAGRYVAAPVQPVTTTRATEPQAPVERPPGPAGSMLTELIETALERNPEIQAAIEQARSKASRVPRETALPDPMLLTKTYPEPIGDAMGNVYFVLSVEQQLPVPGKLDRRGRLALEEVRMEMAGLEQTRLRVIGEVKRSYFQLYAIDKTIAITEENEGLLRDLVEVARGQLVAGQRQQEDVLRAQVELSNLSRELSVLRQRRATTVALLNALLDRPPPTPAPAPADYDARRVEFRVERLLDFAAERNPELRQLESQIARDEHAVELAKLEYWPDFNLGFEWMNMQPREAFRPPVDPATGMRPAYDRLSEEGADVWGIMFGFNVPVWFEKIEAGIREAKYQLSASRRRHSAVRNTVAYKVQDALARVASQCDIAELFATSIVPQAQQAFEVSRAGYIAGTTDFQYVIDNWQKWLFFRVQYYETLSELERSIADLEETIGVSMVEAEQNPPGPAEPSRTDAQVEE